MKNYIKSFSIVSFILFLFFININNVFALEDGCTAYTKYSITTGKQCGSNLPSCSSVSGYQLIKGASCTVDEDIPVVFNFKARDPEGDNLTWGIDFGDSSSILKSCPSSKENTRFSVNHVWANAGAYNVKLSVSDCKSGDASASFNVIVRNTDLSSTVSKLPVKVPVITSPVSNPKPTPTKDATGLKAEFISPLSVLVTWNSIHPTAYRGGYNIYKNGSLIARTRTDFASLNPTLFYDNNVRCPSTQRYQVELFSYDSSWNIVPSGAYSDVAIADGSTCPAIITKIISPNGGESFSVGDKLKMEWQATGLSSNNSVAVSVYKYRSDNSYYGIVPIFGVSWYNNYSKEEGTSDYGSYDWTIPLNTPKGDYIVWVGGANTIQDTSDKPFTVN